MFKLPVGLQLRQSQCSFNWGKQETERVAELLRLSTEIKYLLTSSEI